MAFTTLTMFQLFNVFNARSDERSAFDGLFHNQWLWGALGLSLAFHAAVIYVPFLQNAFSTVSLSLSDWLRCGSAQFSSVATRIEQDRHARDGMAISLKQNDHNHNRNRRYFPIAGG